MERAKALGETTIEKRARKREKTDIIERTILIDKYLLSYYSLA